jgi:MOSC domain-containing protein
MAGERLSQARVSARGIDGDRLVWVAGPGGVRTARCHHRLLGLKGTVGPDGHAHINGHHWTSEDALALVKSAAGDDAWLEAAPPEERFDVLPLLIVTDGAVAAAGNRVELRRTV